MLAQGTMALNRFFLNNQVVIDLPRMHKSQRAIKHGLKRFNVFDCGRRFGKDVLDRDLAIMTLQAGQPVGWWEPTYKSLAENWRRIRWLLKPIIIDESKSEHRIVILGGGVLEMWTLDNPDAGRGRNYKLAILNEAAMAANLEYSWENTIRATLMDQQGWAVFSGTPKGMNYFYDLYQRPEKDPENWARWKRPTWDNPWIPAPEIATARNELPKKVFQQEIQAEFLTDGAYFQQIERNCVVKRPDNPDKHDGHYVVAGLDWARSEDYTVLTIGCRDCNKTIYWDRFNQIDFTYQRERILRHCKRYGVQGLLPERNSIGEPNIEILKADIRILRGPDKDYGFNTTSTSKPPLIDGLAAALEHENFKAPEDYRDELQTYTVTMGKGGHPTFAASGSAHDDRVISLALCHWAMSTTPTTKLVDSA